MLHHPCVLGAPRTRGQRGPSRGRWKKAPHGGPRWFRVTLQPTFLKREKKKRVLVLVLGVASCCLLA